MMNFTHRYEDLIAFANPTGDVIVDFEQAMFLYRETLADKTFKAKGKYAGVDEIDPRIRRAAGLCIYHYANPEAQKYCAVMAEVTQEAYEEATANGDEATKHEVEQRLLSLRCLLLCMVKWEDRLKETRNAYPRSNEQGPRSGEAVDAAA